MSEISVISVGFLGGLSLLVVVLLFAGWRLRRSGRRVAGLSLGGLALMVALLTAADGVNRYFAYLPHAGDVLAATGIGAGTWSHLDPDDLSADGRVEPHPAGGVFSLPVPDSGSGFGASTALVYLPPQYLTQPSRRFPVLYLMHGSPGMPVDWLRAGQADNAALLVAQQSKPVIVVMPWMSHGWLDDPECVDGIGLRVETHLFRDVIPVVDGALRTIADRDARAIGGMSAGGYCALNLGLRHRGAFSVVLDFSGLTRPTHAGGPGKLFGSGPQAKARLLANSPEAYVPALGAGPPTAVWLDTGRSDREVLTAIKRSAAALRSVPGFTVRLELRPGAHTFNTWVPALRESLVWASARLTQAPPSLA